MTDIPHKLKTLQEKILSLRKNNIIELQHGDEGYASAPSNIALIKYWGKQEGKNQIPANSSLSFTLDGFRSYTKVTTLGRFFPVEEQNTPHKFTNQFALYSDLNVFRSFKKNSEKPAPEKINHFINSILSPFAPEIALYVESHNNFPTACGIASSASGYAALVGAIANLLQLEKYFTQEELQYWLSEWARLGSGSATRSSLLQKNSLFVAWRLRENSSEETTTESLQYHENWKQLKHCVLILDDSEKSVSSSHGHKLAHTSPFYGVRVAGMPFKYDRMTKAIKEFDFESVKHITEEEAFSMHAVMQTGTPPACYLNSQVAVVISKFIQYRDAHHLKAFWTLDAGPNIHILYLAEHEAFMEQFIFDYQKINNQEIKILHNKLEKLGTIFAY
ncbi:MAG: diphosphomevalonate decarboxylase [Bdellovibrionota bacterium]